MGSLAQSRVLSQTDGVRVLKRARKARSRSGLGHGDDLRSCARNGCLPQQRTGATTVPGSTNKNTAIRKWLKLRAGGGFEIRAIGAWRSSWKKHSQV
jgi:hypothetical protein